MTPSPSGPLHRVGRAHFDLKVRFAELVARPDGDGWIVSVPCLPGVRSQGDTLLEAFDNAEEALREAIASYAEDGQEVPWVDTYVLETAKDHRSKWVEVNG